MVRPRGRSAGRTARGGHRLIVYGDHADRVTASAAAAAVEGLIARAEGLPAGLGQHAALVTALVEAGRLAQGLADAGLPGIDATLMALARAVIASWDGRSAEPLRRPRLRPDDEAAKLTLRLPEGYAFYALYPESYIAAARTIGAPGPFRVVGIRSIGTALAAVVAAALDAPPPLSVRPVGHPFDRRVDLDRAVLGASGTTYLVVDEGPGLSGSSMVAVVDALERHGVDRSAIVLMPSHAGGPGARAGRRQRAVWRGTSVVPATADIVGGHLERWVETLLGPLDEPPRDVSGGAWRALRHAREADWPAVDPARERRKFIATARGDRWLVRFAGLGADGEAKLARARRLDGLVPEPRGLVHGFLVERWIDAPAPTGAPVEAIATYLGTRARLFPGPPGGSLADLLAMARHNIAEAGGDPAPLDRWSGKLDALQAGSVPVAVDGRCQRHEWLDLGDRLLKADAHDHARAHDLIGAQDIAWDVAGAGVEFDLDANGLRALADRTAAVAGRPVLADLIGFLTPCYLAFRLGEHVMAAEALAGWPAEAARNRAAASRYARLLRHHGLG